MTWRVPLFDLSFDAAERDAVMQVLDSGWLTCGPRTNDFEAAFSEYCAATCAVAVSNCTSALQLALLALDIGPGDEVVVPSLTFVATASAVRAVGATPVFADIESLHRPLLSPGSVAAALTPSTRAVIPMHYAGHLCDMPALLAITRSRGLSVIEDCAHAPGATLDNRRAGTWGDLGCFSFYSNKNISTGEGGMVVTDDTRLADRVRLLRSHGLTRDTLTRHQSTSADYDVVEVGFNYRPTELTSAIGFAQLRKLEAFNQRRAELVEYYKSQLQVLDFSLEIPFAHPQGAPVHHIFPLLLGPARDRNSLGEALAASGVQTSHHYPPVHRLRAYAGCRQVDLRNTEHFAAREITLPLYPGMTESQVDYVCDSLRSALEEAPTRA